MLAGILTTLRIVLPFWRDEKCTGNSSINCQENGDSTGSTNPRHDS